ncbi:phage tail tape measure protein [Microbacterium plantarum]|uniref:phage tail tape measure protein n=1 Tax=Microbacterium plantarum TaxID=1816425 RepID=UPI002B49111B|nr:phage tail tape measure protein [Microbacterium plantarum]WRK16496.1 phage tail tape measure protein [Microbacterium plantarum]
MADRSVAVRLILNATGYMSGMDQVAQKTAKTGTELEKLAQKKQVLTDLGGLALGFGAAAAAGVALAVSKFAEFDEAMSFVDAATHESASNMALLRDAALEAGASTVFSATESANAIEELAKAGVSTADILAGALAGSLDLAAAGGLGVARAAEISATALNQFELSGDQAAHVADVLAAGAGKAMGSVEDLANGLKFVGPVANAMGVSLEETTGVLAMFAQQGIIGEQAGTSLRGVLSSLTSPSKQAREEIDRLGLTLYDSQGNFMGLQNAAGELSKAYTNMDGASRDASLGIIFGRETVTAATSLYKAGAKGVEEWTEAVDDSGYAAETARRRLDNLSGDVEALGGALDTALIQTGGAANETLRSTVQVLTSLVDVFNEAPEEVQNATMYLGIAAATIGLVGGAALLATTRFAEFRANVKAADLSMRGLVGAAGAVTAGLTVVIGIVAAVAQAQAEARARAQAYADTLEEGTLRATKATEDLAVANLAAEQSYLWISRGSAFDAADKLGIGYDVVTKAALGSSEALRELEEVIRAGGGEQEAAQAIADRLGISLTDVSAASTLLTTSVLGEASSYEQAVKQSQAKEEAARELAEANGVSEESSVTAAEAYMNESDAVSGLNDEVQELLQSIFELNGINRDAVSANINFQDALRAADEQITKIREGTDGFAQTLDIATDAGSRNMDALLAIADAGEKAATAQYEVDGSTDALKATLDATHKAVMDRAMAFGATEDEARQLADTIAGMPTDKAIRIVAQTAVAQGEIDNFIYRNADRTIKLRIAAGPGGQGGEVLAAGGYFQGGVKAFAAGGWASGIYPATPGGIHRFAEAGHDEAYITMDPAQKARSRQIWSRVGDRLNLWQTGTPQQAAQPVASSVSIEGARLTGTLDLGNGLTGFVDARIRDAKRSDDVAWSGGRTSL